MVDWSPNDDEMKGGIDKVAPGHAHAILAEWREYGAKNGNHIAVFEIVAHDNPEMRGKFHNEFFSQKPAALWRLRVLAVALGMFTEADFKKAKDEGRGLSLRFDKAEGSAVMLNLEEEEYDGRKSVKVGDRGAGMYRVDDPATADWPRHPSLSKTATAPATKATVSDAGGGGDDFGVGGSDDDLWF